MFDEGYMMMEAEPQSADKMKYVTYMMHRLGISPGYPGFYYLRDAILYADLLQQPVPVHTTAIYRTIAERYETEPRKVERAMHTVIARLTKQMTRADALRIITGIEVDCPNKPFRTMEFVSFVTETLRLHSL